ncbi:hypothetical protein P2N20_25495, partial [Escherichia coli]
MFSHPVYLFLRKFSLQDSRGGSESYAARNPLKSGTIQYLHYYGNEGNDSNLLIVFYVQIMPDDFVMQLHR